MMRGMSPLSFDGALVLSPTTPTAQLHVEGDVGVGACYHEDSKEAQRIKAKEKRKGIKTYALDRKLMLITSSTLLINRWEQFPSPPGFQR